jgi:hypothetical protein
VAAHGVRISDCALGGNGGNDGDYCDAPDFRALETRKAIRGYLLRTDNTGDRFACVQTVQPGLE